jgi:hypothetical protein
LSVCNPGSNFALYVGQEQMANWDVTVTMTSNHKQSDIFKNYVFFKKEIHVSLMLNMNSLLLFVVIITFSTLDNMTIN